MYEMNNGKSEDKEEGRITCVWQNKWEPD